MKRWMIITAIALAVLLTMSLAKDLIIKVVVEKGVEVVTGLRLSTGSFNVGIFRPVVSIKNLKVYNPKGFEDPLMVDAPEIYVDYDLLSMIGGNAHLKEVRFNLAQFTVVKNRAGQLNLDALKLVAAQKQGKPSATKAGKAPQIRIDKLSLKIGKVVYKDYSSGGAPSVREFNVNIDETYTNIDNPATLVSLIVVKALMNTSIANLANFDISGLSGSISDKLSGAQNAVASAQKTAAEAEETVKKTADTLSGVFKSFGSK